MMNGKEEDKKKRYFFVGYHVIINGVCHFDNCGIASDGMWPKNIELSYFLEKNKNLTDVTILSVSEIPTKEDFDRACGINDAVKVKRPKPKTEGQANRHNLNWKSKGEA